MITCTKNKKLNIIIYYNGCDKDQHFGGVGFAVNKRVTDSVICFEAGNEQCAILGLRENSRTYM